jgi:hypothetical protein
MHTLAVLVNATLAAFYLFTGRLPFVGHSSHDGGLRVLLPLGLLLVVILGAGRQYLLGSVSRTRFALRYLFRTRSGALAVVAAPALVLCAHAVWPILTAWWTHMLWGFLILAASRSYYVNFASFREANPAEIGIAFGLDLPNVRRRKPPYIDVVELAGVTFGTFGTFLAAQWGIAAVARGVIALL